MAWITFFLAYAPLLGGILILSAGGVHRVLRRLCADGVSDRWTGLPWWASVSMFLAPVFSRYARSSPDLIKRFWLVGLPDRYREDAFLSLRALVAGIGGFITLVVSIFTSMPIVIALALGVALFYLPLLVLNWHVRRVSSAIERSLPAFLDGLAICLAGGHALPTALGVTTEAFQESENELSRVMTGLIRDLKSGYDRTTAFARLRDNALSRGLEQFAVSCLTAEAGGADLSKILDHQAQSLRQVRLSQLERRAMEAPVKMLAPLVLCIFPATFVVVLAPLLESLSHVFG
jgi:tight adherence protein C